MSLGSGHGDHTVELDYGGRVIRATRCLADDLPDMFLALEPWSEAKPKPIKPAPWTVKVMIDDLID